MTRVAMCPSCPDSVLVRTLAFSFAEFYCLDCGDKFGWLDPRGEKETPELLERIEMVKGEWEILGGGNLIASGGRYAGCQQCDAGEDHSRHATGKERAAHQAALEALKVRAAA